MCFYRFCPAVASMRPPEFTGGNLPAINAALADGDMKSFNEAAGIHRRKRRYRRWSPDRALSRFNEAAGIHRRKLTFISSGCGVICSLQ